MIQPEKLGIPAKLNAHSGRNPDGIPAALVPASAYKTPERDQRTGKPSWPPGVSAIEAADFWVDDQIGIGAAVTRRPLPHHRAYGSVHGGSSRLR